MHVPVRVPVCASGPAGPPGLGQGAGGSVCRAGRREDTGGRAGGALGTPAGVMGKLWLRLREGREPVPRPDGQDAELLNYEY